MPAVNQDMLIDAVDAADAPIGQISRRQVFAQRANFRVVHVLIFNSLGDLLLQQLAPGRERHAGYWGSSVAGYLFSHESYPEAAERRATEELGIAIDGLRSVGNTSMNDDGCLKFIEVFTALENGPFPFDRAHIAALEFVPLASLDSLRNSGTRLFTPTFLHVLRFYLTREPGL